MLEGKKSLSSWKEKNVTLKEKQSSAFQKKTKKQALFQLCFTNLSHKKLYISNVIILKNEEIFSNMIFF
jgi:hypothetical protein